MKILAVDDSFTIRRAIQNQLEKLGYRDVIIAESGNEALKHLGQVDLILTDWEMPEMDGLELVKKIRENAIFSHIPIIMVTGESERAEVIKAIQAGADDYIVKPFDAETLHRKIERVIVKRKSHEP